MGSQRDGADRDNPNGNATDFAVKKVSRARFDPVGLFFGCAPFRRFRNCAPNPEYEQGGQNSDEEKISRRSSGQDQIDCTRHQYANVDAALKGGSNPGTPFTWPGL